MKNIIKKNRYGVSYNVFDGEELLEDSILCIRKYVNYISIVYQKVSNYNNPCSSNLVNILKDLKKRKLVDELFEYIPQLNQGPHRNEINKRNIGLSLSRNRGCTHHMTMDCDEFYTEDEFKFLINWHDKNPEYVSFCKLLPYYKDSKYIIDDNDKTNVTLFFPINMDTLFVMEYYTPVLIDPTRKPNCDKYHVFISNEVTMHHMTMVRKDIKSKYINSSARGNFGGIDNINKIVDYYNNWLEIELMGLKWDGHFNIKKIEPKVQLVNYHNKYLNYEK